VRHVNLARPHRPHKAGKPLSGRKEGADKKPGQARAFPDAGKEAAPTRKKRFQETMTVGLFKGGDGLKGTLRRGASRTQYTH